MTQPVDSFEIIFAGDTVSLENVQATALSIGLISDNGFHLEMELMPGQVVGFSSGSEDTKILLHHGDPSGLLIIRPESAS